MKSVTAQEMRNIDTYCIEKLGIPGIVLMENAALKVLNNLNIKSYDSFTIVCGTGNNGGDGLALARHLISLNKKVSIFIIGSTENLKGDYKINYEILKNMNINLHYIHINKDISSLKKSISESQITVDAVFGTGLCRNVEGIYKEVLSIINNSSYIVSIDVPSGLNADTGEIMGISVKANKTITFQLIKKGFLNNEAKYFTGEIIVEPIGMPQFIIDMFIK